MYVVIHIYNNNVIFVVNIKVWTLLNKFMNVEETFQSRESSCFIQRILKIHQTYLENLCIIHLKYLEVRDSSNVLERFVNLFIMVILVVIMKDFSTFLGNGHYVYFMVTIMKDFSCDAPNPGGPVDQPSTCEIPVGIASLDTTLSCRIHQDSFMSKSSLTGPFQPYSKYYLRLCHNSP